MSEKEDAHVGLLDDMDHEAKYAADDEYRKSELRIQALGAAISRRDWHAVEQPSATSSTHTEDKGPLSMSGKKIIEGVNDALAWTRGEGKRRCTTFVRGELVTEELTFEEFQKRYPQRGSGACHHCGGSGIEPDHQ